MKKVKTEYFVNGMKKLEEVNYKLKKENEKLKNEIEKLKKDNEDTDTDTDMDTDEDGGFSCDEDKDKEITIKDLLPELRSHLSFKSKRDPCDKKYLDHLIKNCSHNKLLFYLGNATVKTLKVMCKENGLKKYSKLDKKGLMKLVISA
tara:strand:+ start:46 stop:486 length:441 start_codon:yes stop_codon:yes gene_type:complete